MVRASSALTRMPDEVEPTATRWVQARSSAANVADAEPVSAPALQVPHSRPLPSRTSSRSSTYRRPVFHLSRVGHLVFNSENTVQGRSLILTLL